MGILDVFKGKKNDSYLTLIKEGEYDDAVTLLVKLCKKEPNDAFMHLKLAECYEKLGKTKEAVEALDQVVKIYTEEGFVAKAVAIQKKIARLQPDRARPTSHFISEKVEEKKKKNDWKEISLPPFFTLFGQDELEEILNEGVELRTFEANEVIIQEGDKGNTMFAIVEGKVHVTTQGPGGKTIDLADMGPGDFFGEGSLLTEKPRTATVAAVEHTELLEFPRFKINEIIARYPNVEKVLTEFFETRAEHTIESMLDNLKEL